MKFLKLIAFAIISLVVSCKTSKYTDLDKGLYADIQTNKGDILVKLYAEKTPLTVANFVSLAEGTNPKLLDSLKGKKFYDGIKFYRVVSNFMIQGGDPTGTGFGGPGYKFEDEFPKNDNNELIYKHNRAGILSMANSGPSTNGSQFFITHKETPWLDSKHTVFGKVIANSSEIKKLKANIKDSIKLLKSIDSLKMKVVNSIVKDDVINHIEIIRVGKKARKFDAAKVFELIFNR